VKDENTIQYASGGKVKTKKHAVEEEEEFIPPGKPYTLHPKP